MVDIERFPAAIEAGHSAEWQHGLYDEEAHIWFLEPADRYEIDEDRDFLVVGRPGVDGITFGYRGGMQGFWGFYPIEQRFELLAATLSEFIDGWYKGNISL